MNEEELINKRNSVAKLKEQVDQKDVFVRKVVEGAVSLLKLQQSFSKLTKTGLIQTAITRPVRYYEINTNFVAISQLFLTLNRNATMLRQKCIPLFLKILEDKDIRRKKVKRIQKFDSSGLLEPMCIQNISVFEVFDDKMNLNTVIKQVKPEATHKHIKIKPKSNTCQLSEIVAFHKNQEEKTSREVVTNYFIAAKQVKPNPDPWAIEFK